jgi:nitrogen regulatory protein PII
MKRIEIIANHSVEEDLMDAFTMAGVVKHFTKIPTAHGSGRQGQRTGETVWPEENFVLIVYCEEKEAEAIAEIVGRVKKLFPNEGIKMFTLG